MSKFCFNCGTKLPDDTKFCSACGAQQKTSMQSNSSHYIKTFFKSIKDFNLSKKASKLLIVALVVVLIVALCFTFGRPYEKPFDYLYDVMIEGKADKLEKLAPEEYWEWYEDKYNKDLEDIIDDSEDEYEDNMEYLEDEYGEDFEVDYELLDKEELDKEKLNQLKKGINKKYDIPKNDVKKGYMAYVKCTFEGEDTRETDYNLVTLVKIRSDWYMIDCDYSFVIYYDF